MKTPVPGIVVTILGMLLLAFALNTSRFWREERGARVTGVGTLLIERCRDGECTSRAILANSPNDRVARFGFLGAATAGFAGIANLLLLVSLILAGTKKPAVKGTAIAAIVLLGLSFLASLGFIMSTPWEGEGPSVGGGMIMYFLGLAAAFSGAALLMRAAVPEAAGAGMGMPGAGAGAWGAQPQQGYGQQPGFGAQPSGQQAWGQNPSGQQGAFGAQPSGQQWGQNPSGQQAGFGGSSPSGQQAGFAQPAPGQMSPPAPDPNSEATQAVFCPRCGGGARWILGQNRWGCDRCQTYL